ncbi:MAG TPA: alpha-ketoglutarate-dependent dioxygenase AlkB [Pseudoxanthomonas sp.]|nr:alpha-ketoglutarate-dependent dioxygenase AlkB [Pseudoxanthomonas sp.]
MTVPEAPDANGGHIELRGAELRYRPGWLPAGQADRLFDMLAAQVPWEIHRIRLFGREVDSPRLSCWMGDADATYRYSGVRHAPRPWLPALAEIRERLRREIRVDSNSVLLNRYRNGRDAMGWHSDDEAELGSEPVIASLSLGATRRFVLKHRREPSCRLALELEHGSLLLMAGATQRHYRHALPRTVKPVGERINLTFRRLVAPARS